MRGRAVRCVVSGGRHEKLALGGNALRHPFGGIGFAIVALRVEYRVDDRLIGAIERVRNLRRTYAAQHPDFATLAGDRLFKEPYALDANRLAAQNRLAVRNELPFVHELSVRNVFAHDDYVELAAVLHLVGKQRPAEDAKIL